MNSKAVIFDLNGIFIDSEPLSKRFEKDYHINSDEFFSVLSNIMDVVRKPGAPKMYGLWKPHLAKWGVDLPEAEFLHYWFSAEHENKSAVEYARSLKNQGWKVFVLSNNFKERVNYYKTHFKFIEEVFNHAYFSFETGNVKPSAKCFTQILDKHRLDLKNCFYFDDSEKNASVARGIGIKAHKYTGLQEVKKILGVE